MKPIDYFSEFAKALKACKEEKDNAEKFKAADQAMTLAASIIQTGYHSKLQKLLQTSSENKNKSSVEQEMFSNWSKVFERSSGFIEAVAKCQPMYQHHFKVLTDISEHYQTEKDQKCKAWLRELLNKAASQDGIKEVLMGIELGANDALAIRAVTQVVEQFAGSSDLMKEVAPGLN
jgi:hypothetical protein